MNTKAPLKGRTPSYVEIDGVECVVVPLGKEGKHGTFTCDAADWETYLSLGYSLNLTVNSSGQVVTSHRGSRKGRANNVTFVSIIMPPRKGHRVRFANGDRRDLRWSNLFHERGRGWEYTNRHNFPDPRKGMRKVPPECIPLDAIDAYQRKDLMTQYSMQTRELPLPKSIEKIMKEEYEDVDA